MGKEVTVASSSRVCRMPKASGSCEKTAECDRIANGRPKRKAATLNKSWLTNWQEEDDIKRAIRASLSERRRLKYKKAGINGNKHEPKTNIERYKRSLQQVAVEQKPSGVLPQSLPSIQSSRNSGNERMAGNRICGYPSTEDFITFLCYRGTSSMPPELEFFEKLIYQLPAKSTAKNTVDDVRTLKKREVNLIANKVRSRALLTPKPKTLASKLKSKATKILAASAIAKQKQRNAVKNFVVLKKRPFLFTNGNCSTSTRRSKRMVNGTTVHEIKNGKKH